MHAAAAPRRSTPQAPMLHAQVTGSSVPDCAHAAFFAMCALLLSATLSFAQTTVTLSPVAAGDGPFNTVVIDGVQYYQVRDYSGHPAYYMYFAVPGTYAGPVYLQVFYKDDGAGRISVQYDGTGSAYQGAEAAVNDSYGNTGSLQEADFLLSSPAFSGRQNSGADLRLYANLGTNRLTVHQVVLWTSPPPAYTAASEEPWRNPYSGPERADAVDPATLSGKVICGYQGWFSTPHDGSDKGWAHWSQNSSSIDAPTSFSMDMWPETRDYRPPEIVRAGNVTLSDGSAGYLFSPFYESTVQKHFEWMRQYGIDGVLLQRFVSGLGNADTFRQRTMVLNNVRAAAHQQGRVWAIQYDVSGCDPATVVNDLRADWIYLHDQAHVTDDGRYLRHDGKPVVSVWGFGFTSRPFAPDQAAQVLGFLQNDAVYGGLCVIGGVPSNWRTLSGDSQTDPAWTPVYRQFDILEPWSVTRYNSLSSLSTYNTNVWVPDLVDTQSRGKVYLPVVFPGFSWDNLQNLSPGSSVIPRLGGDLFWKGLATAKADGAAMIKVAMFDEVNEGTAIFKVSDNPPPASAGHFVTYDGAPPDWYLSLAGRGAALLARRTGVADERSITTNGSFEANPQDYVFPNGADAWGWHFEASSGASGSATALPAAASDGSAGVILVRESTGAGACFLAKLPSGVAETVPHEQRVYKVLLDAKNGGPHSGTGLLTLEMLFADPARNRSSSFTPAGTAFETFGAAALSDDGGKAGLSISLPDGNNSAWIDSVRLIDVTTSGNRVLNGGFEHSSAQILNWRTWDLSGAAQFTAQLDAAANSGRRALRITRTLAGADDGAVDLEDNPVPALGYEHLNIALAAKKLSGDNNTRLHLTISEYDSSHVLLRTGTRLFAPGASYEVYRGAVQATSSTREISLALRVGDLSSGIHTGSYLVDDLVVAHDDDLLTNGGFEHGADGDTAIDGWRFFATGGAAGSATVRSAASPEGYLLTELVRNKVSGGDSALVKDGTLQSDVPPEARVYKFLASGRDNGAYSGSGSMRLQSLFAAGTGETNRVISYDPQAYFERIGFTAESGTSGQAGVRLDLLDGSVNRSVYLDDVQMLDVTRGERTVNGGFENSTSRTVNWRTYSNTPGQFIASLSSDASSGNKALRIERTAVGDGTGASDAAVDLYSDRIFVRPGEFLEFSFSAKKLSGDANARPFVSLAQYAADNTSVLQTTHYYTDNPGTNAYQRFTHALTVASGGQYLDIRLRVGNVSGSDRHVGVYLVDDVSVLRNHAPVFGSAQIRKTLGMFAAIGSGYQDLDGDSEQYLYQWLRNGVAIPGATAPNLTAQGLGPADSITCVVTAYDGLQTGNSIETGSATVPVGMSGFSLE